MTSETNELITRIAWIGSDERSQRANVQGTKAKCECISPRNGERQKSRSTSFPKENAKIEPEKIKVETSGTFLNQAQEPHVDGSCRKKTTRILLGAVTATTLTVLPQGCATSTPPRLAGGKVTRE